VVAIFKHVVITATADSAYNNVRSALSGQDLVVKAVYMGMDPAGAVIPDNATYDVVIDIAWVPVLANIALMPA